MDICKYLTWISLKCALCSESDLLPDYGVIGVVSHALIHLDMVEAVEEFSILISMRIQSPLHIRTISRIILI